MRVDVIENTSHLPRGQPASVRDWRGLSRAVTAEKMHSQRRREPFQIEALARSVFAQLAPAQRTKPRDHLVLDPDRGPNCEITFSVEGFLPHLCYEAFIECDRKEGGRCTATHPERNASIAE